MASSARSLRKPLLLLVAAATSLHCQVKTNGLAGALAGAGAGGEGEPSPGGDAVATGGQAGQPGQPGIGGQGGQAPPSLDAERDDAAPAPAQNDGPAAGGGAGNPVVHATGGVPGLDAGAMQAGGAPGSGGVPVTVPNGTTSLPNPQDPLARLDGGLVVADAPPALGPDVASPDLAAPPVVTVDGAGKPPLMLLWSDEFEGAAGDGIDPTKWTPATWSPGQVNNEKQRYTASRQNLFLDGNGHLVIRGLRSSTEYTSGRIESSGKLAFKTGRVEVRAKLPAGIGSFPGIIGMGTTGAWPACGEIGIMEQYGQDKSWYYASTYASGPSSGDQRNMRYQFPDAVTASADFHVYAADWSNDQIVIQVDDQEVLRTSFGPGSPFATTPEYLVLDVAIGGTMGGTIDPDAFPMDMVVDYVRVYAF